MGEILQEALTRREFFRTVLGAAVVLGTPVWLDRAARGATGDSGVRFIPVGLSRKDRIGVPAGYLTQVVVRWGDPVTADAPLFDPRRQTAEAQARQFGCNCDFVTFLPLPRGSRAAGHGLLWVNHEYTDPELMFFEYPAGRPTREMVDVELAAHGGTIVEVRQAPDGSWTHLRGSRYNRRITGETPCLLTGPAAGHAWMHTREDPTGLRVRGTLSNCAGGKTPWGTVLTCEENFHQYFASAAQLPADDPRVRMHARYGIPRGPSERRWELYHERFDVSREPNEPFRFGWVVEVDPYDPTFVPRKRTALGRFKHEGATVVVSRDGRVVVYSGDDERFEYVYKFVSSKPYRAGDRAHNLTLLDEGTLYVARFYPDGSGEWLPLVFGHGPLTPENGFGSQADVLLNARGAADLLEATRMDRPEDIEAHPLTGTVYVVCTNNGWRTATQVDPANPRAVNRHGHVLELFEAGGDHAATRFRWQIFLLSGQPHLRSRREPLDRHGRAAGRLGVQRRPLRDARVGTGAGPGPTIPQRPHRMRGVRPGVHPGLPHALRGHPAPGGGQHAPAGLQPVAGRYRPPRPAVVAVRHREGREIGT
ncbi:MAG: PhoX family phosphatase [Armatimonadota bacterium]|nr:PhoX family phosphatase [Armatimonadota bacterium]